MRVDKAEIDEEIRQFKEEIRLLKWQLNELKEQVQLARQLLKEKGLLG